MVHPLSDCVYPINSLPACQLVKEGIDVLSHCSKVKKEAVLAYYSRVDADLLFCFSDIVIQSEAMGAQVLFAADAMPAVAKPASHIRLPKAFDVPRMRVNGDTIRTMATAFPGKALTAMVYGPFTVAGQVAGEQALMKGLRTEPTAIHRLLEKCTQLALDYAALLVDAGASVIWVSDPFASLLSAKDFQVFARDGLGRIFNTFTELPTILHICGDTTNLITPMAQTGVQAISFDQCMKLPAVEDQVPDDICIIGNIDPVADIADASMERIDQACRDQVCQMGTSPRYSLSTGCALPINTPTDNVVRFMTSSRRYLSKITAQKENLWTLNRSVCAGDVKKTNALTHNLTQTKTDPEYIIHAGLMRAVRKASSLYEAGQFYLPDLLLLTDAFYSGFAVVKDQLPDTGDTAQVVLGVVEGDFHEIGKDIVKAMLEANGIGVVDLGTNVRAVDFVHAAQSTRACAVAMSAFTTASRKQIQKVSALFRQEKIGVSLIVGGAAVSKSMALTLGADAYARDAVGAVRLVQKIMDKQKLVY